jgi:hypothetical protein
LFLSVVWEGALEITYDLTPEDTWQFNLYYRRHKAVFRTVFLYSLAAVISLVFLGSLWGMVDDWLRHRTINWLLLLLLPVMVYFTSRFLPPTKKRITKYISQQPGYFCEHHVSLSPEWFAARTSVHETKIAWAALYSVEENQSHIFLFQSKNLAHIVPKRAFSSLAEAETFFDTARRYWDAAKHRTPIGAEDASVWPPAPRPGA